MNDSRDIGFKIEYKWKSILILTILVIAMAVVCLSAYIFGKRLFVFTDIGADTFEQYVNQYASLVNHIKEGNWTFWDGCNGLGANIYMLDLFNPATILIVLTGLLVGTEHFMSAFVYFFILAIILSGIACYFYLSCFPFSEKARISASFIYAFNGYLVVWGQHYSFGFITVMFPILLLVIERCLRDQRKWLGVTVISGLTLIFSFYLGYMSYLFAAGYTILRCLAMYSYGFRDFAKRVLKIAGSMVLGIGISAFNFIPSAFVIFNITVRVSGNNTLWSRLIYYSTYYGKKYYQILAEKFLISTTFKQFWKAKVFVNYYEDPNVFFTFAFIILAIQLLVTIPRRKTARKNKILMYISAALIAVLLLVPDAALIFNGGQLISHRFTFTLMPIFALVVADMLDRDVIWLSARVFHFKKAGEFLYALALVLIIANVFLNTRDTLNKRGTLMKDDTTYSDTMYGENIQNALSWLKQNDTEYYRVEKDYGATLCMDAEYQNYHSISSYNSVLNGYLMNFINKLWPQLLGPDKNHVSYRNSQDQPVKTAMLDVKYLISKSGDLDTAQWKLINQFGDLYVYQNTHAVSLATFYTHTIKEEDYAALTDMNTNALLSDTLLVTNKSDPLALTADEIDSYRNANNASGFEGLNDAESIKINTTSSDSLLTGTASVKSDGVMMLTIPYERGWSVYVDGQKQELRRVNYGFIGVNLSAGEHSIRVEYHCPYVMTGVMVSIGSGALMVLFVFLSKKKKRLDNKRKEAAVL